MFFFRQNVNFLENGILSKPVSESNTNLSVDITLVRVDRYTLSSPGGCPRLGFVNVHSAYRMFYIFNLY